MRNSNNAIKFLLAQYRAIFKRAYIKGLASAVILTATLAAGQAQATELSSSGWESGDAIITGASGDTFKTTDEKIASGLTVKAGHSLTTSGAIIVSSGASLEGDLTIESGHILLAKKENNQTVYRYDLTGNNVDVNLSGNIGAASFKLTGGTLVLTSGGAGNTNLTAYGNGWIQENHTSQAADYDRTTANGTLSDVDVTVNSGTNVAALNLLTINSGSNVTLAASDEKSSISGDDTAYLEGSNQMQISDSKIEVSGYANGIFSKQGAITGSTITIEDGNLLFAGNANEYTEVLSGSTEAFVGTHTLTDTDISIGTGATLVVAKGTPDPEATEAADAVTTLEITADSTLTGAGTLKVLGGLKIDGDTLKSFVSGTGTVNTSGGASVIEFSDATDLAKFTYSGGDSANFKIEGKTIFKGDNLTVSDLLTKDGNNQVTDASGSIVIDATNLTLGSNDYNGTTTLGFSGATAQNLNFVGDFNLADKVTLTSTSSVDQNGTKLEVADDGTITGNATLVSGGSLTVEQGNYKASGDFTFSGGTLTVQNTDATSKLDSTLALSGDLDIHTAGAASGAITVDGKNATNAVTSLDITDADLTLTADGANLFKLTVQNSGELLAKGDQLQKLLTAPASNSGAQVIMSGGTISLDGNLSLNANQLVSGNGSDDGQLVFSGTGNTLNVDGSLTLTGTGAINIGANNDIVARNLQLNNVDSSNKATLQAGDVTVLESLTSTKATNTISISGGNLNLGGWVDEAPTDGIYEALSQGGTIGANLSLDAAGSTLTVANGTWTGSSTEATVSAGKLVVGDTNKVDANGQAITATLDIAQLKASVASGVEVRAGSTLNVDQLDASGSAITVNGIMNVDGKYSSGSNADDASDDTYGINLAADSITVGNGAKLNFGADATKAITLSDTAGDLVKVANGTFAAGAINLEANGEVGFAFDADTSFSKEQIQELRVDIFGATDKGEKPLAGFINLGDGTIEGMPSGSEINWDQLEGFSDIIADVTTNDLKQSTITNIDSTDNVRGNVGSLKTTAGTTAANLGGNTTLNNAEGNGGNFVADANGTVGSLNATTKLNLELNNGGNVKDITMAQGGTLTINSVESTQEGDTTDYGTTVQGNISAAKSEVIFGTAESAASGTTYVQGTTDVAKLTTEAGATTVFNGKVTVGADTSALLTETSTLAGNTTFNGDATFKAAAVISAAQTSFAQDVDFESAVEFLGNTQVSGTATTDLGLSVDNGATVSFNRLVTQGNIYVGSDVAEGAEATDSTAGTLIASSMGLNGKDLIVDPAWDNPSGLSFAAVGEFSDNNTAQVDAGILNGGAYALQNSILAIGTTDKDAVLATFERYINAQGNLSNDADGVGAIVYIADNIDVATGGIIVADKTNNVPANGSLDKSNYRDANGNAYGLYLGDNSVLGVEVSAANGTDAAITFADDVTIAASDSGKIVLTGEYDQDDNIKLFADQNGAGTVDIANNSTIKVETINGLLTWNYNGQNFSIGDMEVDIDRANLAFSATSAPVHHSLVAYGTNNTAWNDPTADKDQTKTHGAYLNDRYGYNSTDGNYYLRNADGTLSSTVVDAKIAAELTTVEVRNPDYVEGGSASEFIDVVYAKAYNPLLEAITQTEGNNGAAAESAARMADFGGVAQVALKAGASTYEAISGRMGMGPQNTAMTYANNGQGTGIWVTPIYMNSDSDGFEAQGLSYGTDINLYGVALGGDYTLANGIRIGGVFNVGSGDADGQGAGSAVTSDFDYYGFGLYAGYSVGQFSVVGDISYTMVDNDVEAGSGFSKIGTMKTSLDAANLSIGVTGAYAFEANGFTVTPHAGLRYSNIDLDDYTVQSSAGTIGSYDSDSLSVFSIPVGVTVASEFTTGSWSIKPSFDLTLTGNFGDDENEGTFKWDGVENIDSALTSEIFDNFTYGASLGIAAQSASGIALGLTVGYTGSSNVDDLSVGANARFTF